MGTAAFALESGNMKLLFDPFLELAGGTTPAREEDFREYDTIFVTHCHFDHLYEAEELVGQGKKNTTLFCTKQCCDTLEGFLEDLSNVVQIRPGETYDLYNSVGTSPCLPAADANRSAGAGHCSDCAVPFPGEPGRIEITVLKGRHIEFQRRHIPDTMSPARMIRYAGNLPFLFWANRTFREAGEIVAFDVKAEGKELLILGSLALDPDESYPEGADVLVLPYQGNNDLPARAEEVLSRLRPRSVVLSHFDNAFPPMSRDTDLRPLKKLMTEKYPEIRTVKPTAFRAMEL